MDSFTLRSTKRLKLVISSVVLMVAMAVALNLPLSGWSIIGVLLLSYASVVWSLDLDLKKIEWVVLPIYNIVLSTITYYALYWFTDPSWFRWGGVVVYAIASYGLLLTVNILNVATIRPLPLARQALSVISLAGFVGLFGSYYLVLSLLPSVLEWIVAAVVITFIMTWPLIWSTKLNNSSGKSYRSDVAWVAFVALIAGQLAAVLAFWPISFMTSLVMAASLSMIIGIVHQQLSRQLTQSTQKHYLTISVVLLAIFYIISQWI